MWTDLGLLELFPDHSRWLWNDYLFYGACGAIGAAARIIVMNVPLKLPERVNSGIHLNALGDVFVGGVFGVAFGHNPPLAGLAGLLSVQIADILLQQEEVLRNVVRRILLVLTGLNGKRK